MKKASDIYDSDDKKYQKINEMAKEKARSLTQWFFDATDHMQWKEAQGCAIKVCEEMLNEGIIMYYDGAKNVREFWVKVRDVLENDLEIEPF